MRRIRFRKPWGRTYGYRALPIPPSPPDHDLALDRPLPARGNDLPMVAPGSRRIIDGRARAGRRQWLGAGLFDLETGPPPTYIRRNTRAQNAGTVGKGTGPGL